MKIKVTTQFLLILFVIILTCNQNVITLSSDARNKIESDVPSEAIKHWDHGRLRISSNGHYLEHEDGTAFFWSGGTVWSLFHRATVNEARTYFEDRQNKGFSVIQACITGPGDHLGGLESKYNIVNGQVPFNDKDPEKPNESFFTQVDKLIDIAAENNLYIGLLPTWGEYVCDKAHGGWGAGPRLFDTDSAYAYGAWIAERYKNKPNIIWINGGDRRPDLCGAAGLAIWRALANGIKSKDSIHLMTFHPNGKATSSDPFHNDSWLDFNMYESHSHATYIHTQTPIEYNRTNPAKPVVNGEGRYFGYNRFEEYPDTDRPYRSQAYWTMLLGGAGYTYGDRYLWCFEKKDDATSCQSEENQNWFDYLNSNGSVWHAYWNDFFSAIEWWKLIPDQTIIAAGKCSNLCLKVAARSTDSDLVVVYFATNSSATIDLNKLTSGGTVKGDWWNPVNKAEVSAGEFLALGLKNFTPPPGWEDAVLLLKSE